MSDATPSAGFGRPDLTAFARLDGLGLSGAKTPAPRAVDGFHGAHGRHVGAVMREVRPDPKPSSSTSPSTPATAARRHGVTRGSASDFSVIRDATCSSHQPAMSPSVLPSGLNAPRSA